MQIDFTQTVIRLASFAGEGGVLWTLASLVAWLLGFIFCITAVLQLPEAAEGKAKYSRSFATFMAGVLLVALPTTIADMSMTVFASAGSPLSYVGPGGGGSASVAAVLKLVSLFGLVFMIRGIVEIRNAGEPHKYRDAGYAKAFLIMLSAVAAIYIDRTLLLVGGWLGWDMSSLLR